MKKTALVTISILLIGITLAGCGLIVQRSQGKYICTGGTALHGNTEDGTDIEFCVKCNDTRYLTNNRCMPRGRYTCTGGTAKTGYTSNSENVEHCTACNDTHYATGTTCTERGIYTCTGGTARQGYTPSGSNIEHCTVCNDTHYATGTTCTERGIYTCTGGTARQGYTPSGSNIEHCTVCNDNFRLQGIRCGCSGGFKLQNKQCVATKYTCEHGTPTNGKPEGSEDVESCEACNTGFFIPQGASVCAQEGQYFCENGTPRSGSTGSTEAVHECIDCREGYKKLANNTCTRAMFTCTNGTPTVGNPQTGNEDVESCQGCTSGYVITPDNRCNHAYVCSNGTPSTDADALSANITKCQSCSYGFIITPANTCILDDDNDGVPNTTDIDDDNDGLIEIPLLSMLHNMRYNLAGTSYKTSSADTGSTAGAPTSLNKATDYACSSNAGLCGYELAQNLTFDTDANGTFSVSSGTYTLHTGDNNATYFPVSSGAGGWLPIGDSTNPFVAIFDGNGHTITGLAIKRNQTYIGMFGYIDTGAHIRNVGLVANLADYSGSNNSGIYIGGLVGYQNGGSITASYATGNVDGGDGNGDYTGGLVGLQDDGSITASYATGSTDGGAGANDYVGGLVGRQSGGSITASYATRSVNGGDGNTDYTGGLVGAQTGGSITASYATGNVNGGGGTGDYVGQLIGRRTGGSHSASYGFGAASNVDIAGINGSTLPSGITTAVALTAANLTGCVGIANEKAYTSRSTCEANSKAACNWASNTCSGNVTGTDCSVFTTQTTCLDTTKTAGTWNVWNSATSRTAGAWDFGDSSQTPALKYADYDGAGTTYSCDMFPAGKCGTLLPGQR